MKRLLHDKYGLCLVGFISVLIISIFITIIVTNESILIFPGDSYEQMYQFYLGGWERYRELSLTQFEWSLGFGGNVMSYIYYFMTSPFFLLSLLFSQDFIKYSFLYFNMIKMFLLFFSCYYWLHKHSDHRSSVILGSLGFTFSGWVYFYFAYNIFLEPLILFPLILGLTDEYIRKGKYYLLTIVLGMLGIISYYSLYMFIPFILLYALYQYIIWNRAKIDIKKMMIKAFGYIAVIVVGVGISAVILMPMIDILSSNPRFADSSLSFFDHLSKFDIFKVASSLFVPVTSRLDPNILIDISKHSFLGWGGGASLYMSASLPMFLMLFIKSKDFVLKITTFCFFGILLFFACFFGFYKLFQMTVDTRWFYMFNLVSALIICYSHNAFLNGEYRKRQILGAGIASICMLLIMLLISITFEFNTFGKSEFIIIAFQIALMIGYMMYMVKASKTTTIVVVAMIEVIFIGNLFFYYNKPIDSNFFNLIQHNDDPIEWIKNYDNGFYRILYDGEKEGFDIFTANDPFSKNYRGVSFYSTVYNANQEEFLSRFKGKWSMPQIRGRMESYNLTSTKYWYSYSKNPNPPFGYELIYDDNFKVFQNKYFIELGFGYSKKINENQIRDLDYIHQDQYILEYMVVENETEDVYLEANLLDFVGLLGGLEETRVLDLEEVLDNVNLYIVNFGMPECHVKLYLNDVVVFETSYWQYNYIDIPLESMKIDKIEISCPDFLWNESDMYVYTKPLDNYVKWFHSIENTMFNTVEVNGDRIVGEVTVARERPYVLTSIPYDKGWTVKVDDKVSTYYKANMGFIGLDMSQGTHKIVFEYQIPLLREGIIISIGSLFILTVYYLFQRKRANDER